MENRIIKFRAWDKKSKRILEVSMIGHKVNKEIDLMAFGTQEDEDKRVASGGSISSGKFVYGLLEIALYNFILMQFTGLKDSKGVEIYEGDIVELANSTDSTVFGKKIGVVKFMEHRAYWYLDTGNFNDWTELHKKVIGNIYEDENLLK